MKTSFMLLYTLLLSHNSGRLLLYIERVNVIQLGISDLQHLKGFKFLQLIIRFQLPFALVLDFYEIPIYKFPFTLRSEFSSKTKKGFIKF